MAWNLLNDPQVVEIDYGGAAGGGKSLFVCFWMAIQCRLYPGIRIGVGRKELKRLKETTLHTLLYEAHDILGVKKSDYIYNDMKGVLTYRNGSQIILVDLARQPSDPDFDALGSLNLTHNVIEEAGEIVKEAKDSFTSRKNRWKNREYNIVGKTILTQNPSQNFTRKEFYEPYKQLGMGDMQRWPIGNVNVAGQLVQAFRAFIKALPTDNPFLDPNYIEVLNSLPVGKRKRLKEGNWDYLDNDDLVLTSLMIDRAVTGELGETEDAGHIAVDIADKGNDKTILAYEQNNVLQDLIEIPTDPNSPIPIGEQIAMAVIKYAQQHGVPAKNIAIDVIGVGTSTRDFLKKKGWHVKEFIAGSSSDGPFKNLRAEAIWGMRVDIESGKFKFYDKLRNFDEFRIEAAEHTFDDEDNVTKILPKKKVKEALGYSPDYFDAAYMCHWCALGKTDKRTDSSRIRF